MFLSEYPSPSRFCKHSLGIFLSLLLLSACSPDNDALPGDDDGNTPSAALRIEVSASDFTVAGGSINTRATDNGPATTFENGDRIGIIVLDNNGTVLSDNIPYKYNGITWSFDYNNGEGKTTVYYDNKAVNYIAYFPYSVEANGIAGADILAALKAKFKPQYDQRTKNAYRASDLLTWSGTPSGSTSSKTLGIAFTHAYSSLSLSPSIKCKINGAETSYISSSVDDVSFTIGTEPLLPYRADDSSHRIIVSPQTAAARWFCSYKAKTYGGTMSETALAANNRYTLAPVLKDISAYTFTNAQVGDFYCKSSDGSTGYLIPGDVASLTDAQKADCLGVVMKVGRGTDGGNTGNDDKEANNWRDEDTYKQKDGVAVMSIHGYVLALKDGNSGNTCAWGSYGEEIHTDQARYILFCGYKNTQKIKEYVAKNTGKTLQNNFPAAYYASEGYEQSYPSPSNSSGWFLPSAGQCWYWYKNRDLLLTSMQKAGGNGWQSYYWSSSESGGGPACAAWYVDFNYGDVIGEFKSYDGGYRVRSSLAF